MNQLRRSLGLWSAIGLVISAMVGTGVFRKVAPMAAGLQSPGWVLGVWALAGLVSLAGALTNAELAALFPQAGGEYAYYRHSYGRLTAFLYGWASFMVLKTATIAAQAHVFGQSVVAVLGLTDSGDDLVRPIATGLVLTLSWLNHRGLSGAAGLTRWLTGLMAGSMGLVVALGLLSPTGGWDNLSRAGAVPSGAAWWQALSTALLGAFWGYEGWNYIGYMGEEIRQPRRTLPRALALGTAGVVGLYVLLNGVFLFSMPIDDLASLNQHPNRIAAVELVRAGGGAVGAGLVSALLVVVMLNATNATVLMSARLFWAMARDGLFFRAVAWVHPRYQTPSVAIAAQGVWAICLIWSGTFDQLTDQLVLVAFFFYGLTAVAVIRLRRQQPQAKRPFRVPGYPVLPGLFGGFCFGLVLLTALTQPRPALVGLGLVLSGLPVYVWLTRPKARR